MEDKKLDLSWAKMRVQMRILGTQIVSTLQVKIMTGMINSCLKSSLAQFQWRGAKLNTGILNLTI